MSWVCWSLSFYVGGSGGRPRDGHAARGGLESEVQSPKSKVQGPRSGNIQQPTSNSQHPAWGRNGAIGQGLGVSAIEYLAHTWRTAIHSLAIPYPPPIQLLSDSYPKSIRQTVNAWNYGIYGDRGDGTGERPRGEYGMRSAECGIAGRSHPEPPASERRKEKAARTFREEANGFKKLYSGASTIPESSQLKIRNLLKSSNFQVCFLEENRKAP